MELTNTTNGKQFKTSSNYAIPVIKLLIILLGSLHLGYTQVQINPPFAMPDVNIIQDGDKVYAFCGTDLEPYNFEINTFIMPYWRCYSSYDLINWKFESYLKPEDTWMGKSDKCFAGHGTKKGDKWYWYYSNYVKSTGVVVADSPKGPWKDVLKKPLLPSDISITKEYDACAFTDDDGRSYLIYGAWVNKKICYHIVELNDDMVSLKGTPKKIEVNNVPEGHDYIAVDAPFMHKHNGLYYLSWRKPYAVSKKLEGPYEFVGLQDAKGHLGFFTFNNQWFVNYTSLKKGYRKRYRFASIAYVHFNDDGTIAKMEDLVKDHGVGQYDANWPFIEAEWFMAMPDGPVKKMQPGGGFEIQNLKSGDYLNFPNIHNCDSNVVVELTYSAANTSGEIIVKVEDESGPGYGRVEFQPTGSWDTYKTLSIPVDKNPPGTISMSFVFESEKSKKELIRVDKFRIK